MHHLTKAANDPREGTQDSVDGYPTDIEKFREMAEIRESYCQAL